MTSNEKADRGVLYWAIGILITVNLGLMGWSVAVLDGKADDAAVARIERQAEEIGRRDRDYLVRSQIEDLVRNGSPYVSDKPKIEDQLDKLEASVARNEGRHPRHDRISGAHRNTGRADTRDPPKAGRQARRDHRHAGPRRGAGKKGVRGLVQWMRDYVDRSIPPRVIGHQVDASRTLRQTRRSCLLSEYPE